MILDFLYKVIHGYGERGRGQLCCLGSSRPLVSLRVIRSAPQGILAEQPADGAQGADTHVSDERRRSSRSNMTSLERGHGAEGSDMQ
jgi:hypothetical protein